MSYPQVTKMSWLLVVMLTLPVVSGCQPQQTLLPFTTVAQMATNTMEPNGPIPEPTSTQVEWPDDAIELPFEVIEQKIRFSVLYHESREPKLVVVARSSEMSHLTGFVSETAQEQLQAIDYDTHLALAVFQGLKTNDGYSVQIEHIVRTGNEVKIYAQFEEPQPDRVYSMELTSPYCAVQVQKVGTWNQRVSFSVIVNGSIVASDVQNIP